MTLTLILKVIPPVRQYSLCDPEHFPYNVDIWPWVTFNLVLGVFSHLWQDFLCSPAVFPQKVYFLPWMTLALILKVIPSVLQYSPRYSEHFAYNVDFWPWVTLTLTFKVIHLFLFVSGWSHWLKYFKPERNPFTSKRALIFRLIFGLSNLFDFCEQIEKKNLILWRHCVNGEIWGRSGDLKKFLKLQPLSGSNPDFIPRRNPR